MFFLFPFLLLLIVSNGPELSACGRLCSASAFVPIWLFGGREEAGGLWGGQKKRGEGAALHFRMLVVPAVCRRIRSQKGRALSPTALVIEVRDDI